MKLFFLKVRLFLRELWYNDVWHFEAADCIFYERGILYFEKEYAHVHPHAAARARRRNAHRPTAVAVCGLVLFDQIRRADLAAQGRFVGHPVRFESADSAESDQHRRAGGRLLAVPQALGQKATWGKAPLYKLSKRGTGL